MISPMNNHCSYLLAQEDSRWPLFLDILIIHGPSRSSVVTESMSSILSGGNIDIADYIRNIFGLELTNQDITRRLETLHSRLGRHLSVLRRTCHIFVRPSMFNIEPYFHTTHTLYYLSTATSHYVTGTESQFTSRRIEAWYDNFGCGSITNIALKVNGHYTNPIVRFLPPIVNYLGRTDQFGGATLTMVFYAQIAGHRAALRIETVGMHQDPHIAGSSLAVYRALFMPMFWAELIRKYNTPKLTVASSVVVPSGQISLSCANLPSISIRGVTHTVLAHTIFHFE